MGERSGSEIAGEASGAAAGTPVRLPVARVAVDTPLAHLDRPFDYAVTPELDQGAQPGVRVRVRFAGKLVDGFVLERTAASAHPGRLAPLASVVSAEPVLDPAVAELAQRVAARYAGSLADVLRLAVPARHARAERAAPPVPPVDPLPPADDAPWDRYPHGRSWLAAVRSGGHPRAVWTALPGEDWPAALATAARASFDAGRGSLLVVPDHRDVARVDAALQARLGVERHVVLTAELGPEVRYRRWLAVRRGQVRVVLGTRAAAFAPVRDLGLVVVWDDGDDLHAEPRAPYPHVREVLLLRAHHGAATTAAAGPAGRRAAGCAALVAGFAVTAEAASLVESGWARGIDAPREAVRAAAPRVVAVDDIELARDTAAVAAHLPSLAWRTAREALVHGPVLVQVPRRGYLPSVSCQRCRTPARCSSCQGPLAVLDGGQMAHGGPGPVCRRCGHAETSWQCGECGDRRLRAAVVGAVRTAEELGRAFPSVPVRTSGRDGVLATVEPVPALVVATPGAEPVVEGGYAAALLLDGWALLGRADLRAAEEALRRWLSAAALVRPASAGGRVVVLADAGVPAVAALVRWDPIGHAERELAERASLRLPPAARVAELTGAESDVAAIVAAIVAPSATSATQSPSTPIAAPAVRADVLGPVPLQPWETGAGGARPGSAPVRTLLRVCRTDGLALAAALHAAVATRTARKEGGSVRIRIDPVDLG